MRIVITADPYLPVPPRLYGGIERIIDFLARGLVRRGHRVTLVAHPDSDTAGELVPYGRPPHQGALPRTVELAQVGAALLRRAPSTDVVHSFGRLAALMPILPLRRLPKIQSYQRAIPWGGIAKAARLGGPSVAFTGCSASLFADRRPEHGEWHAIWNGVEVDRYQMTPAVAADAPLVFLGRIERIKGVHAAIAIARGAGRRLIIAGNRVSDGDEPEYFEREVAPHVDGDRVVYVGPVDDAAKNTLLGQAAAMLMPIEWEEPFGIVMVEALACGAPVVAFPRGSVPEVVKDGVNGFVVAGVDEAVRAISKLAAIDRRSVRADCEARFSADAIVDEYEALYNAMIERVSGRSAKRVA
jgi:glycosyltransferase involved in cell wall biosynthesis